MTLQIKDWNIHFENDRSRQRDKCSFVCVPNKQHGMGFARIMQHPQGAAIYGIWQMIVGACSQQRIPRDGWLTDNGESEGSPWGVEDLAIKFRRPVAEIQVAIEVLCGEKVGWITSHHEVTADSPPTTLEGKGREGKERREGNRSSTTALSRIFDSWNANPRLTKCLVISDKRRRSLECRLREPFFAQNWEKALAIIPQSEFCMGKNDRGWKANFDWFIQPDTVAKIIEGKYSNNKTSVRNFAP